MTVAELIEKLSKEDPEAEVFIDMGRIPGIGEVYGAYIEEIFPEGDYRVTMTAVAP